MRMIPGYPCAPDVSLRAAYIGMLPDFSAAGGRMSVDESLARLGLDSVAGLRVHDPDDTDTGIDECLAPDGILAAMRGMRAEGKIGAVRLAQGGAVVC
jgi:aryl-alcohol dehydrogenase-like predicted oxidoreductase